MKDFVLEFIDSLIGGADETPSDNLKDLEKKMDGSVEVDEGKLADESDITAPIGDGGVGLKYDYKTGHYPTSVYLTKFLSTVATENSNIEENIRMKKSILELLFEEMAELKNSQGVIGIGEDDDELGAAGADATASIDDGLAATEGESEKLDGELDKSKETDELFGDDNISGEKVAECTITNKRQYKKAVDHLFANLCEISCMSSLPVDLYESDTHKEILKSYFKSITESEKPLLWEKCNDKLKLEMAKRISKMQKGRDALMGAPTKTNAKIVERYLGETTAFIRKVNEVVKKKD